VTFRSGRHFLQLPGPSNVPDRILRAISHPTNDHRGPAFQAMAKGLLEDVKKVFKTRDPVFIFPGSGSGGWESAITNTLSFGDRVLMFDQGFFASQWAAACRSFGLEVVVHPWDPRTGVTANALASALASDSERRIQAVLVVHNETSTGVTTDLSSLRPALDDLDHPALLMVDAVSSLGAMDFQHQAWGIDVTVSGSQKGLMLPPGLCFNAVSQRALARRSTSSLPCSYWDWGAMIDFNSDGFFPYTPATNLLFGLVEGLAMLEEEGLENVFTRHTRFATATRTAVGVWDLELVARNNSEASNAATSILVPTGVDADRLRKVVLKSFDMSLGAGLGSLKGSCFRIGHLGDLNELSLVGTLGGVEMGLALAGVEHQAGGTQAAMDYLRETSSKEGLDREN